MTFDIRDVRDTQAVRYLLGDARAKGLKIGITSGCYDLFHHLHLTYLQRCRRMCDLLIVGLDSDDLVKRTKGDERPIIPEHQRIALLNALKCVDFVFIMGEVADFKRAVEQLSPDMIFKNQNFRPQDVVGREFTKVITVPDVIQPDSTSGIIERIKKERAQSGAPSDIAPAPVTSTPCAAPKVAALRSGAARSRRSRSHEAK